VRFTAKLSEKEKWKITDRAFLRMILLYYCCQLYCLESSAETRILLCWALFYNYTL